MKRLTSFSLAIVIGFSIASNAYAASDKTLELKIKTLERFALNAQVPAMKDYDIRVRRIIVPAGAKIEQHQHLTTPGIVYVESGRVIEYRDKQSRVMVTGDSLVEDVTTVHSYFNDSTKDCVLIAFDLPGSFASITTKK